MDDGNDSCPPRRHKLLFWMILGAFSVFFAEVVSGSYIFPYFTLWGILVVCPLYTLHLLVLSHVVFRYGKPTFYTLFAAGALFGMYEAYMTKVLWDPTWADPMVSVGGIAVAETIMLVFFWHAFMAFIIPVFIGENLLTCSRETISESPDRIRQMFKAKKTSYALFVLLALAFGIFQSANSPSPAHSVLSGISTTSAIMGLICLWRFATGGRRYDMRTLLPSRKEFLVLAILLLAQYVFLGIILRPEALPGLFAQSVIWLIYAGLIVLLVVHLRKSRKKPASDSVSLPVKFSWKTLIILSLLFTGSSAVAKLLLTSFGNAIMLSMWLIGGLIGIYMLALSIAAAFRGKSSSEQVSSLSSSENHLIAVDCNEKPVD